MSDSNLPNGGPYDASSLPKVDLIKMMEQLYFSNVAAPMDLYANLKKKEFGIINNVEILHSLLNMDCPVYFIKDVSFQCIEASESNTWYKQKTPSILLDSISKANQIGEHYLSDDKLKRFVLNIHLEVQKRWYN